MTDPATLHAPSVLMLSTADWDRPLWTNKQHLASRLHDHLGQLDYVNSLGLRRPSVTTADVARALGKARSIFRHDRRRAGPPTPAGLRVLQPIVVPYHRPGAVASVNRRLLERTVAHWLSQPQSKRVLWTFSPVTYDLHDRAAATVYHCVDLLAEIPGYDRVAIAQGERALAHSGARAIASSRVVAAHLESVGFRDVLLWENVADVDLIEAHSSGQPRAADHVVFAGNLTPLKVDFELLAALVTRIPRLHLELAGPLAEGGGKGPPPGFMDAHPRVHYHGTLSPVKMAELFGRCTVGLVPYRDNAYTSGVFPMKLFEYLAAGLAVVSTSLPSLPALIHLERCETTESFVAAVDHHARCAPDDVVRERIASARAHSWVRRGSEAYELILEELHGVGSTV
jgi:teichuronic acid biosynthesis glycosyltransferase TuaH